MTRKIILGAPPLTVTVQLGYGDASIIFDLATKVTTSDGECDFKIVDAKKVDKERLVEFVFRLQAASLKANYPDVYEGLLEVLKFNKE